MEAVENQLTMTYHRILRLFPAFNLPLRDGWALEISTESRIPYQKYAKTSSEIIKTLIGTSSSPSSPKPTGRTKKRFSCLLQAKIISADSTQSPLVAVDNSASERERQLKIIAKEQVFTSQTTKNRVKTVTSKHSNYTYGLLGPIENDIPTYTVDSDTSEDDDEIPLIKRLTRGKGTRENQPVVRFLTPPEEEDELDDIPLSVSRRSTRLNPPKDLVGHGMNETDKWNYTIWKCKPITSSSDLPVSNANENR